MTYKTLQLLSRVFDKSEDELFDTGILNYRSDKYAAYFGDNKIVYEDIDFPFYFVKRNEYDNFLHNFAVEEGADTHLGDPVSDVDVSSNIVLTKGGREFSADYIIGADGSTSRVRRSLSEEGYINTTGWKENLAIGTEAYVPREAVDIDPDYPLLHFGVLDWGYGWVFPNTNRLLIGVGGLNNKNDANFRQILSEYFDVLGIDYSPDIIKGHPIPFGNYIDFPAYENTLLIGDAAGTVDAISGEGIFYAQRSGELAAYAIAQAEENEESPATTYVSYLKDYVHPEMKHSKRTRLLIWAGPEQPRSLAMKVWFPLLSSRIVDVIHGKRIYKYLRSKGEEMHESTPELPSD